MQGWSYLKDLVFKKDENVQRGGSGGGGGGSSNDDADKSSSSSSSSAVDFPERGLFDKAAEALGVVPRVLSSSRKAGIELDDDAEGGSEDTGSISKRLAIEHAKELQIIKQAWMQEQMRKKITEYADESNLKVFCGTWNVAASYLDDAVDTRGILDWLNPPDGGPPADVYAIGFQEIVDLNAVNVVMSDQENAKRVPYWRSKIDVALRALPNDARTEYVCLTEKSLVGLLFFVWVRLDVARNITDLAVSSIAMGIMGIMGNKGGLSIRFNYNLTSFCFVCAHFYPDREGVKMRNANFFNILENSVFERQQNQYNDKLGTTSSILYNLGSGPMKLIDTSVTDQSISIKQHDLIFWMGDLNYRIDVSVPTEVVFAKCTENAWTSLIIVDQLNEERTSGLVFQGFEEGEIQFPPTYKYEPRSRRYENRQGKKLRAPAWCDRVLWRANKYCPESVTLEVYNCCSSLMMSDHRPVYATFQCKVHTASLEKERQTYQELMRFLDKWENATAPRVEIPLRTINFGSVDYLQPATKSILIRNTGGSIARWVFVTKHSDSSVCKPYLKINPISGILSPGEETNINVIAMVNDVSILELRNSLLDDILVLRVVNGADAFIVVSGELNTASVREYESARSRPISGMGSAEQFESSARKSDVDIDLDDIYGSSEKVGGESFESSNILPR